MAFRSIVRVVPALLFISAAPPAEAQAPAPVSDSATLATEMSQLNRTLDELVQLVGAILDNDRVELLIRRIELQERRLAPKEAQLRRVENNLFDVKSDVTRIQEMLDDHERALTEEIRDGKDQPDSETRQVMAQLRLALKDVTARYEETQLRQRRLEDDLAEDRERIDDLDDLLREMLE